MSLIRYIRKHVYMQEFRGSYTSINLPPLFLVRMPTACPVVVPVNPCASHLVELLSAPGRRSRRLHHLRPRSRSRCIGQLPSSEKLLRKGLNLLAFIRPSLCMATTAHVLPQIISNHFNHFLICFMKIWDVLHLVPKW